ncbi:MAG: sulfotransferase domain-containing protein [Methylocella sp.]
MNKWVTKFGAFRRRFQRPASEAIPEGPAHKAVPEGFVPITQFLAEDIFIVGYPRSGNTWFQNLVAGVIHGVDPRWSPSPLVHDLVPDLAYAKFYRRYATPMFFKSHALPCAQYRRVVYLLRDGRDAMVSYRHYREAIDDVDYDFLKFVSPDTELYPCHWSRHVDAWMQNPYGAQLLIIKYEDLLREPVRQLKRFCQFTGISRETEHLTAIAVAASYRNLRDKEAKMGFGRPDQNFARGEFFFRRGIVGSYKDEMSPEVLAKFLDHAAETLRCHGYLLDRSGEEKSDVRVRAASKADDSDEWAAKSIPVIETLSLLTPFDIDKPKIRIGPNTDGGYTLVDDFSTTQIMISYGIGAEYRFDIEMAERGHDVYMFDHTIEAIQAENKKLHFFREGVAGQSNISQKEFNIKDHLCRHQIHGDRLILKMDVEGAEFDALESVPDDTLNRFEQIVLEVHWLNNLDDRVFRDQFRKIFRRLNSIFTLFHVHANNWDGRNGLVIVSGIPVSPLLELSYVRSTSVHRRPSQTLYPTVFDYPNTKCKEKLLWFYPFLPTTLTQESFAACAERAERFQRR